MAKGSMKESNTQRDTWLLDSGLLIGSGFLIGIFVPELLLLSACMKVGGWAMFSCYILTESKYNKIFKFCGIKHPITKTAPLYKKKTKHYDEKGELASTVYHFRLPTGLSTEDIEKKKLAIEQYLCSEIEISYGFKELIITEHHKGMPNHFDYVPRKLKGFVPIYIGLDRYGEVISFDLGDGEGNMLIAGTNGSGKSNIDNVIICNLILCNPEVQIGLIDMKKVEFSVFKNCGSVIEYCANITQALNLLQQIYKEVMYRYKEFEKVGVRKLSEYNAKCPNNKMPYKVIFIDEYSLLCEHQEIKELVIDLTAIVRASGINIVISTQRPSSDVLCGRIRANLATIVGLRATTAVNSRVIIDDDILKDLKGKGEGYLQRGIMLKKFQAPFFNEDAVIGQIKATYVKRNNPEEIELPSEVFEYKETPKKGKRKKNNNNEGIEL